jgi:hypothetical protein
VDIDDRIYKLAKIWREWNEREIDGDKAMLEIGKIFKPYLKWRNKLSISEKRLKIKKEA